MVLGPLLFCLHINDLPSCIQNCKIHMFADDTSIQCSASSVVDVEHSFTSKISECCASMDECQQAKVEPCLNICNADRHKAKSAC